MKASEFRIGNIPILKSNRMIRFNKQQICKVVVSDFSPSKYFKYLPDIKIMGKTVWKRGYYIDLFGEYLGENAPSNHTMINGIVYKNPSCTIYSSDLSVDKYSFDSMLEAIAFCEKITSGDSWMNGLIKFVQ